MRSTPNSRVYLKEHGHTIITFKCFVQMCIFIISEIYKTIVSKDIKDIQNLGRRTRCHEARYTITPSLKVISTKMMDSLCILYNVPFMWISSSSSLTPKSYIQAFAGCLWPLIDWIVFYAVSAIFQPYSGGYDL